MPEVVESVPDPWEKYADGRLWRFTREEINAMPRHSPLTDPSGEIIGPRQSLWSVGEFVYVRFTDRLVSDPKALWRNGLDPWGWQRGWE